MGCRSTRLLLDLATFDPIAGATWERAERVAGLAADDFDVALGRLVDLCLVRRSFDAHGENLFLHPLTHAFAQGELRA